MTLGDTAWMITDEQCLMVLVLVLVLDERFLMLLLRLLGLGLGVGEESGLFGDLEGILADL